MILQLLIIVVILGGLGILVAWLWCLPSGPGSRWQPDPTSPGDEPGGRGLGRQDGASGTGGGQRTGPPERPPLGHQPGRAQRIAAADPQGPYRQTGPNGKQTR
ncbi:hypothetical protein [Frankia sp. R82]|uniref:hypothetical protein n=1 Tax=Frankia sp. R82 TaxID=2950553 RepID=UPI0020448DB1|nr:hypothetical protein [Frankia sp. R82]MCM3887432.1 hypothetical protein [Frankia sp. R82]